MFCADLYILCDFMLVHLARSDDGFPFVRFVFWSNDMLAQI